MADMSDQVTANGPFFTVLPAEVRISILNAALGGRTVHIVHESRKTPQSHQETSGFVPKISRRAVGIAKQRLGRLFGAKTEEKSDAVQLVGYRMKWRGYVCCRPPDVSPTEETCLYPLPGSFRDGRCLCGSPMVHAVGALGWLLTCRQAYDEGIPILYGSNTFQVRRDSRLRMLGQLTPQIPKTNLSHITSVELIMEPHFLERDDFRRLQSERKVLERTLSSVPRLMPNLKELYIGFETWTCLLTDCKHGGSLQYNCTKYLAGLVEAVALEFARMGKSCDVELAIPSIPWETYYWDNVKQGRKTGYPRWKPEHPSRCSYHPRARLFQPAHSRGPESESGNDGGGDSEVGYWISISMLDFCTLGPVPRV